MPRQARNLVVQASVKVVKAIIESYVFITDIRGSHFGSILEIKGWLLDVLIGNQNQDAKGIRIGDKITEGTDTLISK
jgi:hypothetical protein